MSTFSQKIRSQLQEAAPQPQEMDTVSLENMDVVPDVESAAIGGLFVLQDKDLVSARRLVVLMPDADVDEAEVAREIWELAFPPRLAVLLLGVCSSVNEESRMRRRLATVAALTREPRISVEVRLEFGRNWVRQLKSVLEAGDIVVCHAEQQTGILRQPLELQLAQLNIPTLTLKGFISPMYHSSTKLLRESIFWLVSIAIVMGFFWLQMQTLKITEVWAKNVLLGLSIPIELASLWLWHFLSV